MLDSYNNVMNFHAYNLCPHFITVNGLKLGHVIIDLQLTTLKTADFID